MPNQEEKRAELRRAALEYHEFPTPGKVAIAATNHVGQGAIAHQGEALGVGIKGVGHIGQGQGGCCAGDQGQQACANCLHEDTPVLCSIRKF